jgi:hypothetical protein
MVEIENIVTKLEDEELSIELILKVNVMNFMYFVTTIEKNGTIQINM